MGALTVFITHGQTQMHVYVWVPHPPTHPLTPSTHLHIGFFHSCLCFALTHHVLGSQIPTPVANVGQMV